MTTTENIGRSYIKNFNKTKNQNRYRIKEKSEKRSKSDHFFSRLPKSDFAKKRPPFFWAKKRPCISARLFKQQQQNNITRNVYASCIGRKRLLTIFLNTKHNPYTFHQWLTIELFHYSYYSCYYYVIIMFSINWTQMKI